MKPYAVRQTLRTPVQCTLSYSSEAIWTNGRVWDLSQTGWRATGDRPMSVGHETIVFLSLCSGEKLCHILIESAIVRWSDGLHAGWEITRIDAATQSRLAEVVEQCDQNRITL
ncbi:MAG: PilZ domain-containing protein [Nitrospira sp.]